MRKTSFTILMFGLIGFFLFPLNAKEKVSKEERLKQSIVKEVKRAKDVASYHGNTEYLNNKYGHLKDTLPKEFEAVQQARKHAGRTWEDVAKKISGAKSHEEIQLLKNLGYDAQDIAEIAHMEMRAADSIFNWRKAAEKYESKEIKEMVEELVKKQEMLVKSTIQEMLAEKDRRSLEIERRMLEQKMRAKMDEVRRAKYDKKKAE